MVARKGGLTGSKRVKEQETAGSRAKKVVESAKSLLDNVSSGASKVVEATATVSNTVGNLAQIATPDGYQKGYQSASLAHRSDVYGIGFPKQDFNSMMPSDLLNPQIELQASEEQLTKGLQTYAGGVRAQQLYQAGYKYFEETGKTRQQYHKAEIAHIKASTLGVKVDHEIVNFDIANVELDTNFEKLRQTNLVNVQAKITTQHFENEVQQLRLFYEAKERNKVAQIQALDYQSMQIEQKYLSKTKGGF